MPTQAVMPRQVWNWPMCISTTFDVSCRTTWVMSSLDPQPVCGKFSQLITKRRQGASPSVAVRISPPELLM